MLGWGRGEHDDWVCQKCGGTVALQSVRMEGTPRILLLHLKRFQSTIQGYRKNEELVKLPETVLIGQQQFRIIGRVNHSGALNAGHYTADLQIEPGQWIHCNDSVVRSGGVPEICSRKVYIVVCERMDQ